MIRAIFDQDQVTAVVGGIELARHFPTLEWDHLMYTGSTELGRLVAVAAAQNLTPVTLELGGKCPALVAEDGINDATIEQGATLLSIGGEADRATRRMPMTLVLDPSDDMEVMRNEIFGPILPIKTYRTLDEAIDYINARDRPLGIYAFTETPSSAQKIRHRTVSGGACLNAAAMHAALPSLPFGGGGKSGTGRHDGLEGFLEFPNPRAVFEHGNEDLIRAMYAPYGELADAVISGALEGDHQVFPFG